MSMKRKSNIKQQAAEMNESKQRWQSDERGEESCEGTSANNLDTCLLPASPAECKENECKTRGITTKDSEWIERYIKNQDGTPRGMKAVLIERGINVTKMKTDETRSTSKHA